MSRSRKVRSNAVLLNLPPARQEPIIEWCDAPKSESGPDGRPCVGGYQFAREQLASDGLRVSLRALSDFYSAWHLEQDLEISFEREEQVLSKTGDAKKAREAGEALLMRLGLASQNAKLIVAAAQTSDNRRHLDLLEESGKTKADIAKAKLSQKDRDHALAVKKFQRESCKLFLKWFDQEAAKKIATGTGTNAEKIEQLGRAMFGEDWHA